jgi:hypothetical protein
MDDENDLSDPSPTDDDDSSIADAVDEDDDRESDGGLETDLMPETEIPEENLNPSAPADHEAPDAM